MRSAVIILAVVSAVTAEAPYHLPRPAPHAPSFGYPSGPAQPAPLPQFPQPRPPQHSFVQPAPAPQHGYNYQPPSFGPAFVQPAPQPAPHPIPVQPAPRPIYLPAPQPQPIPISYLHPQPIPISYPQPQPQPLPISYPQPQPQPLPISYPQPQPQPLPISYPQPQPQPLPISYPQPQPSYGAPQQPQPLPSYNFPQTQPAPIVPLPAPVAPPPQPQAPLPLIQPQYQSVSQGYSYPQQVQYSSPLPLQSQPLTNNAVSSYQSDSSQYSGGQAQIHGEALDDTVVSRVQNIIKENEHSSARNAGYLSLVSGVSLENAKPSVEISSFVHNSPQNDAGLIDVRSAALSSSASAAASPASSYDVPAISAGSSQSSESSASFGFLPQTKPAISYGAPN